MEVMAPLSTGAIPRSTCENQLLYVGLSGRMIVCYGVCGQEKSLCKKASNHHANLPLEMYSFTL